MSFRAGGRIGDELVELEGRVTVTTTKAMCIEFTNTGKEHWCPKSQIVERFEGAGTDGDVFHIKEWWCKKEGLI